MALPTIGRIVIYRHPLPKGGGYDVPAVVSATPETIEKARDGGLDSRHLRELTDHDHLHLTVFTPLVTSPDGVEHARDVPAAVDGLEHEPGTWRWPERPKTVEQPPQQVDFERLYVEFERRVLRKVAERRSRRYG